MVAKNGHVEIIKYLMGNIQFKEYGAAGNGHLEMVKYLESETYYKKFRIKDYKSKVSQDGMYVVVNNGYLKNG